MKRIGVIGLGRSGRAAALLALSRGLAVYAVDSGEGTALRDAADEIRGAGGIVELGGYSVEELARCDLLVVSPGIPPTAPVLVEPSLREIPQVSELEFAFSHLEAPVIAITGTNGKTTTTALTSRLLAESGLRAPAAGNIGTALSEIVLEGGELDWVVVEASSFQLAGTRSFAPRIGVLTNLSPDHLDRYASLEEYYADKALLFARADESSSWVLNGEDKAVREMAEGVAGERFWFRVEGGLEEGELGGFISEDGELRVRLRDRDLGLIPVSEFPLLGRHNLANALAASIAALLAGADVDDGRRGLRGFEALPHRLEPVAEGGGVLWINDSKATNISSTAVAVEGMTRPTILLLGGRHKGEPYTELLPVLSGRVRAVIAYGEAAPLVEADLAGHLPVERVNGAFEDVVERAAELAEPGDAVLLSPACSSFDLFMNYEERGERFRELAARMAASASDDRNGGEG